jgi:hypothetical protein
MISSSVDETLLHRCFIIKPVLYLVACWWGLFLAASLLLQQRHYLLPWWYDGVRQVRPQLSWVVKRPGVRGQLQ